MAALAATVAKLRRKDESWDKARARGRRRRQAAEARGALTARRVAHPPSASPQDELLDAVYWTRAGVAAVLGTVAGIAGAEGVGPFVVYGSRVARRPAAAAPLPP